MAYLVVNGIADPPTGDSVGVTYLSSERLVVVLPDDLLSEGGDTLGGQLWPRGSGLLNYEGGAWMVRPAVADASAAVP